MFRMVLQDSTVMEELESLMQWFVSDYLNLKLFDKRGQTMANIYQEASLLTDERLTSFVGNLNILKPTKWSLEVWATARLFLIHPSSNSVCDLFNLVDLPILDCLYQQISTQHTFDSDM